LRIAADAASTHPEKSLYTKPNRTKKSPKKRKEIRNAPPDSVGISLSEYTSWAPVDELDHDEEDPRFYVDASKIKNGSGQSIGNGLFCKTEVKKGSRLPLQYKKTLKNLLTPELTKQYKGLIIETEYNVVPPDSDVSTFIIYIEVLCVHLQQHIATLRQGSLPPALSMRTAGAAPVNYGGPPLLAANQVTLLVSQFCLAGVANDGDGDVYAYNAKLVNCNQDQADFNPRCLYFFCFYISLII
jgi:hypothetical protein